jgi:deoxyribose-phosphate aldolase
VETILASPSNTLDSATLAQLVSEIAEEILRSRSALTPVAGSGPKGAPSLSQVAAAIDHTNLKPEATRADILNLCAEARDHHFATVCVQPIWVSDAERALRGTSVVVCTVIGFPSGAVPAPAKCAEAALAIRKGARELDMVIPIGLLRQGDLDAVQAEIHALASLCHRGGAMLKVILETAALSETEIAVGSALARLAGADFVKTSTGFHPAGGATEAHVRLLRQAAGPEMGVKAAGGIRSAQAALAMLAAGANRLGSSASVRILEELAQ